MAKAESHEALVLRRIDSMIELLEDLFILEAARAGMKQQEIRKLLGVSIVRVNRIAKHVEK